MNADALMELIKTQNEAYLKAYEAGYAAGIAYVLDKLERRFPKVTPPAPDVEVTP